MHLESIPWRRAIRALRGGSIFLAATLALGAGVFTAEALAAGTTTTASASTTPSTSNALTFGIYPGGDAGGASGSNPDNVANDLSAVQKLDSSGAPFVVHLYAEYYGPGSWTAQQEIGSEVQAFSKAGFKVELVECYRPTDRTASTDVPGFVSWTQQTLGSLGRYLSYLQVTNEANETGDPTSNDGAFSGADDALIQGVEAAKTYITSKRDGIQVGFNWSYDGSASSTAFWSYLQTAGGSTFVKDLDWVGIDVYPGTWQSLPSTLGFGDGVAAVMTQAIAGTRDTYMPLAGIPASVPIQITETGYPTGPSRTYAMQDSAMESEVHAVEAASSTYNVTTLEYFDLRDAITNSTIFEDQYGLMTDQWVAKPAFTDYQSLITSLSAAASGAETAASGSTTTTTSGSTTTTGGTPTTATSTTSSTPITTATTTSTPTATTTSSPPLTTATTTTTPTTPTTTTPKPPPSTKKSPGTTAKSVTKTTTARDAGVAKHKRHHRHRRHHKRRHSKRAARRKAH